MGMGSSASSVDEELSWPRWWKRSWPWMLGRPDGAWPVSPGLVGWSVGRAALQALYDNPIYTPTTPNLAPTPKQLS